MNHVKLHNRKGASQPYVCRWSNCSFRSNSFFKLVQHCTDSAHFLAETAVLSDPLLSNGSEPVLGRNAPPKEVQPSSNSVKVEEENEEVVQQFKVENDWLEVNSEALVEEVKHSVVVVESGWGNHGLVGNVEERELKGEESVGNICNICLAFTQDPANHAR